MPLFLQTEEMRKMEVYLIDTDSLDAGQAERYISRLDAGRKEKIQKIRPEAEKKRSVGAGLLVNRFCSECGYLPEQIRYGKYGKPCLEEPDAPAFNLSHSGKYAVLAYEKDSTEEIGIDIQEVRQLSSHMANRILCTREMEQGAVTDRQVLRLWTIKEAFAKMTGRGLTLDFKEICCDLKQGICVCEKEEKKAYFKEIEVDRDYFCCVCSTKPMDKVRVRRLDEIKKPDFQN